MLVDVTQVTPYAAILLSLVTMVLVLRIPKRADPPPPADACSCSHARGAHDPDGGKCYGDVKREHYNTFGDRRGYEWVPCPCRHYDGLPDWRETLGGK